MCSGSEHLPLLATFMFTLRTQSWTLAFLRLTFMLKSSVPGVWSTMMRFYHFTPHGFFHKGIASFCWVCALATCVLGFGYACSGAFHSINALLASLQNLHANIIGSRVGGGVSCIVACLFASAFLNLWDSVKMIVNWLFIRVMVQVLERNHEKR